MKWPKRHFVEEEQRIVRKFALLPVHTDDEFMVWLESYWSLQEYRFVVEAFITVWVELYKGSTYSSCKEYQYQESMKRRR
jgi:hypothetical protein